MHDLSYKNPSINIFNRYLGREMKTAPICAHPGSRSRDCVRNVEKYISVHGGRPVHVWQVVQQGDLLLFVRPHAIVHASDNRIVDITPDEYELGEASICYFDNCELFRLPLPPARHISLIDNPNFHRSIEIMNLALEIHSQLMNQEAVIKVNPEELSSLMIPKVQTRNNPTENDRMLMGKHIASIWKNDPNLS